MTRAELAEILRDLSGMDLADLGVAIGAEWDRRGLKDGKPISVGKCAGECKNGIPIYCQACSDDAIEDALEDAADEIRSVSRRRS